MRAVVYLLTLGSALITLPTHAMSGGIQACQGIFTAGDAPALLEDPISLAEMDAARATAAALQPHLAAWSNAAEDMDAEKVESTFRQLRQADFDVDGAALRDLFFVIQRGLIIAKGVEGRLRPLAATLGLREGESRRLINLFAQMDSLTYAGHPPPSAPAFLRRALDPDAFITAELGPHIAPVLREVLVNALIPVLRQRLRYARLRLNDAGTQLILLSPVSVFRINLLDHAFERPSIASPHVSSTDAWGRRGDQVIHAQIDLFKDDPEAQSYLRTVIRPDPFFHPHNPLPAVEAYPQEIVLSDWQEAHVQKGLALVERLRQNNGLNRPISLGMQMSVGTGKRPMALSLLSRIPLGQKRADIRPKYIVVVENTHVLPQFIASAKRDLGISPAKMAMLFGQLGEVKFGSGAAAYTVRRGHKLTPPTDWDFIVISRSTLHEKRKGIAAMIGNENAKPDHLRRPIRLLADEGHHTGTEKGQFQRILDAFDGTLRAEDVVMLTSATLDHEDLNIIRDRLDGAIIANHLDPDQLAQLGRGEDVLGLSRIQMLRAMLDGWLNPVHGRSFSLEDGTDGNAAIRDRLKRSRNADELLYRYAAELIKATRNLGGGFDRGLVFEPLKERAREGARLLQKFLGTGGDPDRDGSARTAWYANSDLKSDEASRRVSWLKNEGEFRGARFMHQYLVTVSQFFEGVDIPVINLLVIMRNLQSIISMIQLIGRGARIDAFKDGLRIIDVSGNVIRWLEQAGDLWRKVGTHRVSTITRWGKPPRESLRLVADPPPEVRLVTRQLNLEPTLQRERKRAAQWREVLPADVSTAARTDFGVLGLLKRTPDGGHAQKRVSLKRWFAHFYDALPPELRTEWANHWRELALDDTALDAAELGEAGRASAVRAFRLLARIFNGLETLQARLGLAKIDLDEALTLAGFARVRLGLSAQPSQLPPAQLADVPSLTFEATAEDHVTELREYLDEGVLFGGLPSGVGAEILTEARRGSAVGALRLLDRVIGHRELLRVRYGDWLKRVLTIVEREPDATTRERHATYLIGQFGNATIRDAALTGLKPFNLNGLVGLAPDLHAGELAPRANLYDVLSTLDLVEHRMRAQAPSPAPATAPVQIRNAILNETNWDRADDQDLELLSGEGGALHLPDDQGNPGAIFEAMLNKMPGGGSAKWRRAVASIRWPVGVRSVSSLDRAERVHFVRGLRLLGAMVNDLPVRTRQGLAPFGESEVLLGRVMLRFYVLYMPALEFDLSLAPGEIWAGPVIHPVAVAYRADDSVLADEQSTTFAAWAAGGFTELSPRQLLLTMHDLIERNQELRRAVPDARRTGLRRSADTIEATGAAAPGVAFAALAHVVNGLIFAKGLEDERFWDLNALVAGHLTPGYDRELLNGQPTYADLVRILERAARPALAKSLAREGFTVEDVFKLRRHAHDSAVRVKEAIEGLPERARRAFAADLARVDYDRFPHAHARATFDQLEHFASGLVLLTQIYNSMTPIERRGHGRIEIKQALDPSARRKIVAATSVTTLYPAVARESASPVIAKLRAGLASAHPGLTPAADLITVVERLVKADLPLLTADERRFLGDLVMSLHGQTSEQVDHGAAYLIARLTNELIYRAKLQGLKPFDLDAFGWPDLAIIGDHSGVNPAPTIEDFAEVFVRIAPAPPTSTMTVTEADAKALLKSSWWTGLGKELDMARFFSDNLRDVPPRLRERVRTRTTAIVLPKLPLNRFNPAQLRTFVRGLKLLAEMSAEFTPRERMGMAAVSPDDVLTNTGGQRLCMIYNPEYPMVTAGATLRPIELRLTSPSPEEHARLLEDLRSGRLLPGPRPKLLSEWIEAGGRELDMDALADHVLRVIEARPMLSQRFEASTLKFHRTELTKNAGSADGALRNRYILARLLNVLIVKADLKRPVLNMNPDFDPTVGATDVTTALTWRDVFEILDQGGTRLPMTTAEKDVALKKSNLREVTTAELTEYRHSGFDKGIIEAFHASKSRDEVERERTAMINRLPARLRETWRKFARELKLPPRRAGLTSYTDDDLVLLIRNFRFYGAAFNELDSVDRLGFAPVARAELLQSHGAIQRVHLALDPETTVDVINDTEGVAPALRPLSTSTAESFRKNFAAGQMILGRGSPGSRILAWFSEGLPPLSDHALVALVLDLFRTHPILNAKVPEPVRLNLAQLVTQWPVDAAVAHRATYFTIGLIVNQLIKTRGLNEVPWDLNVVMEPPALAYARDDLNTAPGFEDVLRIFESAALPEVSRDLAQLGVTDERLLGLIAPGGALHPTFKEGTSESGLYSILERQMQLIPAAVRQRFKIEPTKPELARFTKSEATWPQLEAASRALLQFERMFNAMSAQARAGVAPLPPKSILESRHFLRVMAALDLEYPHLPEDGKEGDEFVGRLHPLNDVQMEALKDTPWIELGRVPGAYALLEETLRLVDERPSIRELLPASVRESLGQELRTLGSNPDQNRRERRAGFVLGRVVNELMRRTAFSTALPWDINGYFGLRPGADYDPVGLDREPSRLKLVQLFWVLNERLKLPNENWYEVSEEDLAIATAPNGLYVSKLIVSHDTTPLKARAQFRFWLDCLSEDIRKAVETEIARIDLPISMPLLPAPKNGDLAKLLRAVRLTAAVLNELPTPQRMGFLPIRSDEALSAEAFERLNAALHPTTEITMSAKRGLRFIAVLNARWPSADELKILGRNLFLSASPRAAQLASYVERWPTGDVDLAEEFVRRVADLLPFYPRVVEQLGQLVTDGLASAVKSNDHSPAGRAAKLATVARLVNSLVRFSALNGHKPWNVNGAFAGSDRPEEFTDEFNPSPTLVDVINVFEAVSRR